MKKIKQFLLLLTLAISIFSCTKSKDTPVDSNEPYIKFTLDGVEYKYTGVTHCGIEYNMSGDLYETRFYGFSGDKYFSFNSYSDTFTPLTTGDYIEETANTGAFDWALTGFYTANGKATVSVKTIKDEKYFSGTITGTVSYQKVADGPTFNANISNGEFKNLEVQ